MANKQETITHKVSKGCPEGQVGELKALLGDVVVTHAADDVDEGNNNEDDDEHPAAAHATRAAATTAGLGGPELQLVPAVVGCVLEGLVSDDAIHTGVAVKVEVHLTLVLGAGLWVESAPEGVAIRGGGAQESRLHTTCHGVGGVQQ